MNGTYVLIAYADRGDVQQNKAVRLGDIALWQRGTEFFEIPTRIEGVFGSLNMPTGLDLHTKFGNLMGYADAFDSGKQKLFFVVHSEEEGIDYIETCINYYKNRIAEGDVVSAHNLGCWYSYGQIVPQDMEKGKKYLTIASERGAVLSTGLLALFHISETEEPVEFISLLRKSAEGGFYLAQYDLGHCYDKARAGLIQDYQQAIYWYKKAAENHYGPAICNLADKYEHGLGVEQNYQMAMNYYIQAAEKNIPEAMFSIGNMYLADKEVDLDSAEKWLLKAVSLEYKPAIKCLLDCYKKAADQGNREAMLNIGSIYLYGRGKMLAADTTIAKQWIEKAAGLGWLPAQNMLKNLNLPT